jgi:hypothetical protein
MPRFYFDHRDGDDFHPDEDGMEFSSVEHARFEASAALGGIARDALPGARRRELAIEVSDGDRKPLFRAALWFEVQPLV